VLAPSWLPAGVYHYDRAGHYLAQVVAEFDPGRWRDLVPSLALVSGGALLWIVVGDGPRMTRKYGPRGLRFLLLEAGHLMQNLCLASASLGGATVPLGGVLEGEVARALQLPPGDVVLYVGVFGGRP
jgi:SagB-type dehydrogenase family enzyme